MSPIFVYQFLQDSLGIPINILAKWMKKLLVLLNWACFQVNCIHRGKAERWVGQTRVHLTSRFKSQEKALEFMEKNRLGLRLKRMRSDVLWEQRTRLDEALLCPQCFNLILFTQDYQAMAVFPSLDHFKRGGLQFPLLAGLHSGSWSPSLWKWVKTLGYTGLWSHFWNSHFEIPNSQDKRKNRAPLWSNKCPLCVLHLEASEISKNGAAGLTILLHFFNAQKFGTLQNKVHRFSKIQNIPFVRNRSLTFGETSSSFSMSYRWCHHATFHP